MNYIDVKLNDEVVLVVVALFLIIPRYGFSCV